MFKMHRGTVMPDIINEAIGILTAATLDWMLWGNQYIFLLSEFMSIDIAVSSPRLHF